MFDYACEALPSESLLNVAESFWSSEFMDWTFDGDSGTDDGEVSHYATLTGITSGNKAEWNLLELDSKSSLVYQLQLCLYQLDSKDNNFLLKVSKTKEVVITFQKPNTCHWAPLIVSGESEQHQIPGGANQWRPLLDHQHCITSKESTVVPLLPE